MAVVFGYQRLNYDMELRFIVNCIEHLTTLLANHI